MAGQAFVVQLQSGEQCFLSVQWQLRRALVADQVARRRETSGTGVARERHALLLIGVGGMCREALEFPCHMLIRSSRRSLAIERVDASPPLPSTI